MVKSGDEWSDYLRRMTRRPGWTVQRLAKESGIARSSLYKWMSEGAGFITIDSVFRVADTLGVDRGEALRAASGLSTLERDEAVERILASDRPDPVKEAMIERVMRRREEDQRRQMEDLEFLLHGEDRAG